MNCLSPDQLRARLLAHCRLCGWKPRRIGQPGSQPGLEEVLEEVIACRELGAHQLSAELIDLTEEQGWFSPWLEDNRAWLLVADWQLHEARLIWERLLSSDDPHIPPHAKNTLKALTQANPIDQAAHSLCRLRARDQRAAWKQLCWQTVIEGADPFSGPLHREISEAVLTRQPPSNAPWDQQLLVQEELLELFDAALQRWESRLG